MAIPTLPPAPSRAQPETFADRGDALMAALGPWTDAVNQTAAEIDADAAAAKAAKNQAVSSATSAVAAANYKGEYSSGTTYQVGQSVTFNSEVWVAKLVNTGITPVEGTRWTKLTNVPNPTGQAGKVLKSDSVNPVWGDLFVNLTYDNRGALRAMSPVNGEMAIVDSLGVFVYAAGSSEIDDDETCFAAAGGRWLIQAVHWDEMFSTVSMMLSSEAAALKKWVLALGYKKALTGSVKWTLTSLTTLAQTSTTVTVTGATVGDVVAVTPPNALGAGISVYAMVTSADTVTIYANNPSASTATLTSGEWKVAVIKQ